MNFLSEEEEYELLVTFNDTEVDYQRDKTVIELFYDQVKRTPDNTALVFETKSLTYRELDEQSNQIADYLITNYSIQADDLVAIMQERSEWLVISILGVLKSGGAYVPIDPENPQERIDKILADSQSKVLLDNNELKAFFNSKKKYADHNPDTIVKPNQLAYVIYTSGSTGTPKGVMIEHTSLVNRLNWMSRDLEVSSSDVFIQKTPVTFDVSVWELFLPLVSGSKLVVIKPGGHKDPFYLSEVLEKVQVSIIHFVPSMLHNALGYIEWERLKNLRHVICSGEALSRTLEKTFKERSPKTNLHNYYGPTEATVDVTKLNLSQHPTVGNEVSIGKPVDNTRIYIVNNKNTIQAVGVTGEILIGGIQVARGYLNQPDLTTEKFIKSPFREGDRLYKTGDLGRWLPDGNIEFAGRNDSQVKLRGYRIELGEIESILSNHEKITKAVVLTKDDDAGETSLVAYITADTEQNTGDLRSYLQQYVPDYMIPSYFVQLEEFPLTPNGKTERKSLPDPKEMGISGSVEYVAPVTAKEKTLASVWSEVLKRDEIGLLNNFYN
ncbi:MAG: amino acid adenylation domain-containing protein, partial [Cyclobacteriaceae bacterium]